jgi:putative acetyltransferase
VATKLPIEIRDERPEDRAEIRALNVAAFGQELEGNIVDALRANGAVILSLVATHDGRIVGHALFSPIVVGGVHDCAALGPMAVQPAFQRRGVGSALVGAGVARL